MLTWYRDFSIEGRGVVNQSLRPTEDEALDNVYTDVERDVSFDPDEHFNSDELAICQLYLIWLTRVKPYI